MKRGQVTIFIIIGILMLIVIGISLYLFSSGAKEEMIKSTLSSSVLDDQGLRERVTTCMETLGREALYTLSSQAGYINPKGDLELQDPGDHQPSHYFAYNYIVPYVLDDDKITLRDFDAWLVYTNRYVAANMENCLDFSDLGAKGIQVMQPEIDFQNINFDWNLARTDYSSKSVRIASFSRDEMEEIAITATYPLRFKTSERVVNMDEFTVTLPLRVKTLHKIAQKLLEDVASTGGKTFILSKHCDEYSTEGKTVNIYAIPSRFEKVALIQIVDSSTVNFGLAPLKMQMAIRNTEIAGGCVG